MNGNDELEKALKEVLDEKDYNEFFNVHRYYGWRKDLEYLWNVEVENKEQLYHRFCPYNGSDGDAVIEIWDRNLKREGLEDWTDEEEN